MEGVSPHGGEDRERTGGDSRSGVSAKDEACPKKRSCLALNRYHRVAVLCLYCLVSGPVYFNWTPIADTLLQHGAFKWRCTPEEIAAAVASPSFVSYGPLCKAQELALNNLFVVASSSHFFCSFLGGLFLDLLGPKAAGMIGIGVMFLGWLLLGLSNETLNCYTLAAVLIGMSIDTAFFPCLSAANLFPGKGSTIIAFLGCFRSLSFVVPLAIRAAAVQSHVATSLQALLVYCGVFLSLCFLIAAFLLPSSSYAASKEDEAAPPDHVDDGKGLEVIERPTATVLDACDADAAAAAAAAEPGVPAGAAAAAAATASAAAKRSLSLREKASLKLRSFGAECCSLSYLPLLPLFSFLLTNIIFYVPSTSHLIPKAYEANQIIQTFSFLPCPFLGLLADRVGILPVMHLTNLCGLLCYACVLIPGIPAYTPLQFLSPILFAIQVSFLMSQLYCYASATFSQQNLGKLIGLVCAVGGLFSLVTEPMRSYSLEKGFVPMCVVALCLASINAAILAFLHLLQIQTKKKKQKQKRNHLKGAPPPPEDNEAVSLASHAACV